MWTDWVSNQGPLALESDALPTALHYLAGREENPLSSEKHITDLYSEVILEGEVPVL